MTAALREARAELHRPSGRTSASTSSVLLLPLLFLDWLPARRPTRLGFLLALVGLAAAPPLLEPASIVDAANLVARTLFPH